MGRVNKFTNGVFTDIMGDKTQVPEFEQFLNIQNLLNAPTKELKKFLKQYKTLVDGNKLTLDQLGKLEDIIMQMRTRDNLNPANIKLNIVREYIYARIPFHRKDKETSDIRVIVGQTEEWGTDLDKLLGKSKFIDTAKNKLILAMDEIINESLEQLKPFEIVK